jgi:CBS domain-containing protein
MDEGSKLLGILTAGDIIRIRNRRSDWDPEISEICSVNYIYADASMSKQEIKELLLHHRILSIPIIDETSKLIDTFEIWDIF